MQKGFPRIPFQEPSIRFAMGNAPFDLAHGAMLESSHTGNKINEKRPAVRRGVCVGARDERAYYFLTSILCGLDSSSFGSMTVRTPSCSFASALPVSEFGNRKLRA